MASVPGDMPDLSGAGWKIFKSQRAPWRDTRFEFVQRSQGVLAASNKGRLADA